MSKYRNKKILRDGVVFDSKKEYEFWLILKSKQDAGEIENLRRQEKYLLIPKQDGERAAHYVADFSYYDRKKDREVVVDVKSEFTRKLPVYRLKKKLMLWFHGIKIIEV